MSKSTKFALDVYRRQDQLISSRPRGLTLRKTRKKNKKSKRRSGGILYNKQAMAKQLKHMIEVLERSDGGRKENVIAELEASDVVDDFDNSENHMKSMVNKDGLNIEISKKIDSAVTDSLRSNTSNTSPIDISSAVLHSGLWSPHDPRPQDQLQPISFHQLASPSGPSLPPSTMKNIMNNTARWRRQPNTTFPKSPPRKTKRGAVGGPKPSPLVARRLRKELPSYPTTKGLSQVKSRNEQEQFSDYVIDEGERGMFWNKSRPSTSNNQSNRSSSRNASRPQTSQTFRSSRPHTSHSTATSSDSKNASLTAADFVEMIKERGDIHVPIDDESIVPTINNLTAVPTKEEDDRIATLAVGNLKAQHKSRRLDHELKYKRRVKMKKARADVLSVTSYLTAENNKFEASDEHKV